MTHSSKPRHHLSFLSTRDNQPRANLSLHFDPPWQRSEGNVASYGITIADAVIVVV